jgi:hypothetical protein
VANKTLTCGLPAAHGWSRDWTGRSANRADWGLPYTRHEHIDPSEKLLLKRPAVRLAVLLAAVATAFAVTAGTASATSCGQQVINDWYGSKTGQLSRIYPIHCYKQALNIVKNETDLEVYSNARQDIERAMALAIAAGKSGGPGGPSAYNTDLPSFLGGPDAKQGGQPPDDVQPYPPKATTPIGGVLNGSSASSVPLPAIVLGAIAALLLALGATAYLARRRQQRRQTLRPRHANGHNP